MADSFNPIFPQVVKAGMAQINTANTNLDGTTGTYGTVLTAGVNGSRIERGRIKAAESTTAGMIRFFLTDGTNTRLITEVMVSLIAASISTPSFEADVPALAGMLIPAGWGIKASTHVAEDFNIVIEYGDY